MPTSPTTHGSPPNGEPVIRATVDGDRGTARCLHTEAGYNGEPCRFAADLGTLQEITNAARAHAVRTGHPVAVEETLIVRYELGDAL